jgi:FtsH-binding integral membrane protein
VLIFTALTAYDTQKLHRMAADPTIQGEGAALLSKLSIMGALRLYLDFINLFLFVLRIVGGRRD